MSLPSKHDPLYFFGGLYAKFNWKECTSFLVNFTFDIIEASVPTSSDNNAFLAKSLIFKDLAELDQKESPRLQWGAKILNLMGVKNIVTKDSIKIFGNPDFEVRKKIVIKDYLKDHRVFMTCVVAGLSFGGEWHIHDKDSIKTSFPSFLKIINQLKT